MIWIFGAGSMSAEYAKVLSHMALPFKVIGRGWTSAQAFEQQTGVPVIRTAIPELFSDMDLSADKAIVCVDTINSYQLVCDLLELGFKSLLVEKPVVLSLAQGHDLNARALAANADLFIALNRRQYSAVEKAHQLIEQDGGLTSMQFEFTEWGHVIEKLDKPKQELVNWFLCNSLHVVDLAFSFAGLPQQLSAFHSGELAWHKPAVFSGSGITKQQVPFSYHADWSSAGRWGIELQTKKRRLYLSPMEQLKQQLLGTVKIEDVALENDNDTLFKPGLLKQLRLFVSNSPEGLVDFNQFVDALPAYLSISGYKH